MRRRALRIMLPGRNHRASLWTSSSIDYIQSTPSPTPTDIASNPSLAAPTSYPESDPARGSGRSMALGRPRAPDATCRRLVPSSWRRLPPVVDGLDQPERSRRGGGSEDRRSVLRRVGQPARSTRSRVAASGIRRLAGLVPWGPGLTGGLSASSAPCSAAAACATIYRRAAQNAARLLPGSLERCVRRRPARRPRPQARPRASPGRAEQRAQVLRLDDPTGVIDGVDKLAHAG